MTEADTVFETFCLRKHKMTDDLQIVMSIIGVTWGGASAPPIFFWLIIVFFVYLLEERQTKNISILLNDYLRGVKTETN